MKRTPGLSGFAAAMRCLPLAVRVPVGYVGPFIGTTDFGTTGSGAVCPDGTMSVAPFNVMGSEGNPCDRDARRWSAPCECRNSFFAGFSHVNLGGAGCVPIRALCCRWPRPVGRRWIADDAGAAVPGRSRRATVRIFSAGTAFSPELRLRPAAGRRASPYPAGESHILLNLGEGPADEPGAFVRRVSDTEIGGTKLPGTFCYDPRAVFPVRSVMRAGKRSEAAGRVSIRATNTNENEHE